MVLETLAVGLFWWNLESKLGHVLGAVYSWSLLSVRHVGKNHHHYVLSLPWFPVSPWTQNQYHYGIQTRISEIVSRKATVKVALSITWLISTQM